VIVQIHAQFPFQLAAMNTKITPYCTLAACIQTEVKVLAQTAKKKRATMMNLNTEISMKGNAE